MKFPAQVFQAHRQTEMKALSAAFMGGKRLIFRHAHYFLHEVSRSQRLVEIYGQSVVYDVRCLLHLADDVKYFRTSLLGAF